MVQWGAKGLLEDLWPWIDKDPEISREDLMVRVLEAAEIDATKDTSSPSMNRYSCSSLSPAVAGSISICSLSSSRRLSSWKSNRISRGERSLRWRRS